MRRRRLRGSRAGAEFAPIDPHTLQDHAELPGDRDPGTLEANPRGEPHAPGSARSGAVHVQQCRRRLEQIAAKQGVTGLRELAEDVHGAGDW